jgi:hypothetical protein
MSAIFTSAQFAGIQRKTPVGVTGNPPGASDQIRLSLSDGSTSLVFDSTETALKCMEFMRTRSQWMLQVNDDIALISCSAVKLLVCEMSLTSQKMLASFSPIYQGGKVLFNHRTMSQSLSLDDALQAVGFAKLLPATNQGNYDLKQSPSPNIIVVDWYFRESVSSSTQGSQLADATPIQYDYTP